MVRSPSSVTKTTELKRGPWTSDEDEILTNHIKLYGHPNWRALPRLAGLARCGKSCRLRWTNYLQPGIKRGNFTKDEEEIIITSHQLLGNRWSAIAAKLPGRTDNEIKNVWHTHLKKKLMLNNQDDIQQSSGSCNSIMSNDQEKDFILVDESIFDRVWDDPNVNQVQQTSNVEDLDQSEKTLINGPSACNTNNNHSDYLPLALQRSYSETSHNNYKHVPSPEELPETDESFWSDVLSSDHDHNNSGSSSMESQYYSCYYEQPPIPYNSVINMENDGFQEVQVQHATSLLPKDGTNQVGNVTSEYSIVENGGDVDEFWFDVLFKAGEHILFS